MNRLRMIPIAAAFASMSAASPAFAKFECYDFSGLTVGTGYSLGNTVNANFATIEFRPYQVGARRHRRLLAGSSRSLPQTRRRKPVVQALNATRLGFAGRPTAHGRVEPK